jgi:hypothetical protein
MTTTELEAWDRGFCAGIEAGLSGVRRAEVERDAARASRASSTVKLLAGSGLVLVGLVALALMLWR